MNHDYDWMIFDLGGVLIEIAIMNYMKKWTHSGNNNEWVVQWLRSPSVRLHETGKIGFEEYTHDIIKEMDFKCTQDEFKKCFPLFTKGPYNGALELLNEVRRKNRVACFSNTNTIHWEDLTRKHQLDRYFDKAFLSFEMGMIKPDKEAFDYVVRDLEVKPSRLLFFDDNPYNIEAARHSGITAFLVNGPTEVRRKLLSLGLI